MTVDQLCDSLKQGVKLLELNRDSITPEVIDNLDKLVTQLSNPLMLEMLRTLMGESIEKTIDAVKKILEVEKSMLLLKPGKKITTNDSLINSFNNLQHKPIVLRMIAAAI